MGLSPGAPVSTCLGVVGALYYSYLEAHLHFTKDDKVIYDQFAADVLHVVKRQRELLLEVVWGCV